MSCRRGKDTNCKEGNENVIKMCECFVCRRLTQPRYDAVRTASDSDPWWRAGE
jgi:hypothetical protein